MRLAYEGLIANPSRPDVRHLAQCNFAGSFIDMLGKPQATAIGLPIVGLEEVNLFTVRGSPQWMEHILGYPFRVEPDAERISVPIVGELYGQEGVITRNLEEQGFISRVTDPQGNPVTVPVFVKTMRQLYLPCGGTLRLLKIGDRTIVPNSAQAVKEAWNLIQPQGAERLDKLVDTVLDTVYRDAQATENVEEFKRRYRPSLTVQVGVNTLAKMKQQRAGNPEVKLDLSRFEQVGVPICGMGIKGPGCLHYDGHHIPFVKDEAQLPPHVKLKSKFEASIGSFVVDTRFDGAKGLLLAIPHQMWSSRPVGGDSIANLLTFERENALLKYGAELSYLTIAVVPLLSRKQVPELCAEQIAIVVNAVLDDSRRMGDFLDERYPLEARRQMYAAAVVEKYLSARPVAGDMGFIEAYVEEARDAHWTRLGQRVGKTLRAVFDAGLTNPVNRGMVNNISFDGGLADALDLAVARHPREFHNFALLVLDGLSRFYEVAGFDRSDWFLSKHFRILLETCLGAEAASSLLQSIASFLRPGDPDPRGVKRMHAIGLVTDEFMRLKEVQGRSVWAMSDEEFQGMLSTHKELHDQIDFAEKSLQAYRVSLRSHTPPRGRRGAKAHTLADAHERLAYERSRADVMLRAQTALSLRENFALMDQEFKQKFGGPISAT